MQKEKSVLLITLRNIGYADSRASAFFAAFEQDSDSKGE